MCDLEKLEGSYRLSRLRYKNINAFKTTIAKIPKLNDLLVKKSIAFTIIDGLYECTINLNRSYRKGLGYDMYDAYLTLWISFLRSIDLKMGE